MPAHYTPGPQRFALRRRQDTAAASDATDVEQTGDDSGATTAQDTTSAAVETTTEAATTAPTTTAAQATTTEAGEQLGSPLRLFAGRSRIGRKTGPGAEVCWLPVGCFYTPELPPSRRAAGKSRFLDGRTARASPRRHQREVCG